MAAAGYPDEFRPQRWLALPDGVSSFKFPVFQGGPRTCLGKEMTFMQMKFVASTVLRRFELRPVDDGRSPVFVRCSPRTWPAASR